ncbi:MAG: hypothetical protein ICCCNLDF_01508 [Planctomycetes bacterium]|nr:hypothetical protein [Planctomycetota bacterium]
MHAAYLKEAAQCKAESERLIAEAKFNQTDHLSDAQWSASCTAHAQKESKHAQCWLEAAEYCSEWAAAWRRKIQEFAQDPLGHPLADFGVPPGGDEVPGDNNGRLFRGPTGQKPDGTDYHRYEWNNGRPYPTHSPDYVCYLDYQFSNFEAGPPREFIEGLKAQGRSTYWVGRALDALHACLHAGEIDTAYLLFIATSRVVFDWHAAHQHQPLGFATRRSEDGRQFEECRETNPNCSYFDFHGVHFWLDKYTATGRTPSARDAEWYALIVAALLDHLVSAFAEEAPAAALSILVKHDKEKRAANWCVNFNGDEKHMTIGQAWLLVRLGEFGAATADERHANSLLKKLPQLETLFERPSKRKGRTSMRDYSAPKLKERVIVSEADRRALEESAAAASARAAGRAQHKDSRSAQNRHRAS